MKKHMRICAIAAVSACVAGLVGCSNYFQYNDSEYNIYDANDNVSGVIIEQTVSSIEADWICGGVEIKSHDQSNLAFYEEIPSENLEDDGLRLRYSIEEDTLKIKFAASGNVIPLNFKKSLTILVPTDFVPDEIEINCVSASTLISGIKTEELDVGSVSGDVIIKNCTIGEADLGSVSADIKIEDCIIDETEVNTVSGDVYFLAKTEELEVKTASGDILLNGVADSVKLVAVSGSVTVSELPKKLEIETTSGHVELNIKSEANLKITYSTVDGKFKSDLSCENDGKIYVYGNGEYDYDVTTVTGNLTVKKHQIAEKQQ